MLTATEYETMETEAADREERMASMAKMLSAGFAILVGVLIVSSCSQSKLDLNSLPAIKANLAHQIDFESKKNLIYEVPAGKGFVLDTSEYKEKYAQASKNDLLSSVEWRIMLDPVGSGTIYYFTVDWVPGRHLYAVCPDRGLRSGEKYTLRLAEECTDTGRWELLPFFEGEIHVN